MYISTIYTIYTAEAVPQGHADKDKAPSRRPRSLLAQEHLMAACAGSRGSEKLHVRTAKSFGVWTQKNMSVPWRDHHQI